MTQLPTHIQALLSPAAYPHPAPRVDLVQTHISYVFLAGDFVYKVKKPVDLGFLDFTTLEKRRFYCQEEVLLNRRLCPGTYLDVVPIAYVAGEVCVDAAGPVVDYAVKMRRLPEDRMMERLLRRGAVDSEMLRGLAAKIADFHAAAETNEHIRSFGGLDTIMGNWRENFEQTEPFVGRTVSRRQYRDIEAYVEGFAEREAALLRRRVEEGRIRDCHGDLRAEAVCFQDGICIFDCIEFNERFRYSDTAADLAFLAMDLDFRRRRALSDELVGLYLGMSGDVTLPLVLDFYKCYRAYVRGKVDGFQLDEPEVPAEQKAAAQRRARRYFRLAHRYARPGVGRALVMMVGVTGTGKSYLANALAGRLGAALISSDATRKLLAGIAPTERREEPIDSGLYSPEATDRTYAAMLEQARPFLADDKPVILDATYHSRRRREGAVALARSLGARLLAVECVADEGLVRQRLGERRDQPWTTSDGRLEVYEAQRSRYEPPTELGELLRVDASRPLGEQLDEVEARLTAGSDW
jgi:aminoglycoside phosphotransferase family enzyme/predicted kinase